VTVHQFGPIYRTEIIAIAQCMYGDYVVWGGGSDGLVTDFSSDEGGYPQREGTIYSGGGISDNAM